MRSIPSVGKQWIGLLLVIPVSTVAAADDASLAQQTLNPVASLISLQLGARYWADSPSGGPDGWGYRAALTFLFPK